MPKADSLIGTRFGRLLVISKAESDKSNKSQWLCQCDCGTTKVIRGYNLKRGGTISCGCWKKERPTTHGGSSTRLYSIWWDMRRRCGDPSVRHFNYYGGRGIAVSELWIDSFSVFEEWAKSNGYDDSLTLDRLDVNGNYEPTNCKWVTRKEQGNNKRTNVVFNIDGTNMTAIQVCELYGIKYPTFMSRLQRGQSIEDLVPNAIRVQ